MHRLRAGTIHIQFTNEGSAAANQLVSLLHLVCLLSAGSAGQVLCEGHSTLNLQVHPELSSGEVPDAADGAHPQERRLSAEA